MMPEATPYGNKGLARTVISLTWPQLCAMICQLVVGLTDVWAAGRLGSDVQASIGLITQLQMMLLLIGFASANGAVAAVSQSFGARRPMRARRYIALILGLAIGIGAIIGGIGFLFRQPLLSLLHTPDTIRSMAVTFINATLLAMPGHYGMVIGSALFRSSQSVILPMYAALAACLVNIVGDIGFGLGYWGLPDCGAAGIAWSTTIAVYLGSAIMTAGLVRQKLLTRGTLPRLRWAGPASRYLIKVTLPALCTSIVWQMGYLLIFIITASLPSASVPALAGLTGGLRIEGVLFMPASACGMTASVLVGNALGAGDHLKARGTALAILGTACATVICAVLCLWPFRESLALFLSNDPSVVQAITTYLTWNFLAEPCSVASIILTGALNGAGASVFPMRAFLLGIWGVRLPVAYILGHLIWGTYDGVFIAMMLSQIVQSACLLYCFLRKKWWAYAMQNGTIEIKDPK